MFRQSSFIPGYTWLHPYILCTMHRLGLPTSGLLLHEEEIIVYYIYAVVILDFLLYAAKIYLVDTPGNLCSRAAPLGQRLL